MLTERAENPAVRGLTVSSAGWPEKVMHDLTCLGYSKDFSLVPKDLFLFM